MRRSTATVVLGLFGGVVGWFGGALWYLAFGPPWGVFDDVGLFGDGFDEAARGAGVGGITGAFVGWFLFGSKRLTARTASVVVLGSGVAAVLLIIGVSYIGDLTNYDPPTTPLPYVGVAGMPLSIAVLLVLRWVTRDAPNRTSKRVGRASGPR